MYPSCTLIQKTVAYNGYHPRYDYAYEAPVYVPPPAPYIPPTQAPSVTLSQMPYTGLDLGVAGTLAYWGFLVLWAMLAAYLLIVKRVQNALAEQLGNILFGKPTIA